MGYFIKTESGTSIQVSGAGPPVILIHGVIVDHRMWQPQVKSLSKNFTIYCIDMLGHGRTAQPFENPKLSDFVNQLDEVLTFLSGTMKPVIGGFSMGGLVAQSYAIQNSKKVSGLILLNTVYDRTKKQRQIVIDRYHSNLKAGVDNAIASGISRWFTSKERTLWAKEIYELENWMRSGNFDEKCKAHRVFAHSDHENTGKIHFIECPTLIMTGAKDSGSTPAMSRKMAREINDSELHVLKNQHHVMSLTCADHVSNIMDSFLQRVFNTA